MKLSAILVPVPCPPTTDPARAPGCIGKGLTGAERLERALDMRRRVSPDHAYAADVSYLFTVFALMPDDGRGIEYLAHVRNCYLGAQVGAAMSPALKTTFREGAKDCTQRPPFLGCFGGMFAPAMGSIDCWKPAEKRPP